MNLAAAQRAANEAAARHVDKAQQSCPLKRTGLIVLVYRDDTTDMVEGAVVDLSGQKTVLEPPGKRRGGKSGKGRVIRKKVEGKAQPTDSDGITRYLPIEAGTYGVTVASFTKDPDKVFSAPEDKKEQPVTLGTCPVVVVPVKVYGRPVFRVVWKHDENLKVKDVLLKLDTDEFPFTDASGKTELEEDGLEPKEYPLTWTLENTELELFDEANVALGKTPKLTIPAGKKEYLFKAQRLATLSLEVLEVLPDTSTPAVQKFKLALKWPGTDEKKPFDAKAGLVEVKDIPAVSGDRTRLEVESLEVDEADAAAYEFVEVSET